MPPLAPDLLLARLEHTRRRASAAGLDVLAVYADREHFANMAYLTGFDPRFEEALLLLAGDGRRKLLVGNECMGYLPDAALGLEVENFQDFSLLGQPRGSSRPLRQILEDFGIGAGSRVGCAGWKYFDGRLAPRGETALVIPAYLADLLRELCGGRGRVVNATPLFMDPRDGLRVRSEAEQIAQFEFAAATTSAGLRAVLERIRPGVREQDLDIIPVSRGVFCYVNAEDGVVLADAALQDELSRRSPECWRRLAARRDWVRGTLGIALHDTVFPLADTTGWFAPYVMDLTRAFVR